MSDFDLTQEYEDLYISLNLIFSSEEAIQRALKDDLFDCDYIAEYILLVEYYKLIKVPKEVLEVCIKCKFTNAQEWDNLVNFLSNKWLEKANAEIEEICQTIENDEKNPQ